MTALQETEEIFFFLNTLSGEGIRGKTDAVSLFPLCSSHKRVPCELPDPSLCLTEGTRALFISHGNPPPTVSPAPPPPASPTLRCWEETMVRRREGEEEGGYIKERLSQWVPVSSRPLHFARWDFVKTHTQVCAHTYPRTKQTTINGEDNVLCCFCLGFFSPPFCLLVPCFKAVLECLISEFLVTFERGQKSQRACSSG